MTLTVEDQFNLDTDQLPPIECDAGQAATVGMAKQQLNEVDRNRNDSTRSASIKVCDDFTSSHWGRW